ncbi:hypothetical protein B0T26DRAFT_331817 [Lasiosphaeria miniovina]|uniref:Uncharacterized protein n=1 Tax=Lasiosphaeria miniovina TaxID=1954250 RepID=A0AA40AMD6_9PEZI|nr:uncharacterized protein B0T26DRAFT_331817 [Lasiosphaeria miniovina]KAK0718455.1 hypothetical protein B0T26DRAFT_331817 [Lasiosphaeria miniovina]
MRLLLPDPEADAAELSEMTRFEVAGWNVGDDEAAAECSAISSCVIGVRISPFGMSSSPPTPPLPFSIFSTRFTTSRIKFSSASSPGLVCSRFELLGLQGLIEFDMKKVALDRVNTSLHPCVSFPETKELALSGSNAVASGRIVYLEAGNLALDGFKPSLCLVRLACQRHLGAKIYNFTHFAISIKPTMLKFRDSADGNDILAFNLLPTIFKEGEPVGGRILLSQSFPT